MTNNRLSTKKLAVASATAIFALFSIAPAFAVTTPDYGVWSEPSYDAGAGTYSGTVTFAGTSIPEATYSTVFSVADEGNEVQVVDSTEEWIPESSPVGASFGSSGPSETNNFLKSSVASSEEPFISSTTTITFASSVPADTLGIVLGDLDIDSVQVSAQTEDGTDLTGEELVGSAGTSGFNLCAAEVNTPTVCDDVTDPNDAPVVTPNADDVLFVNSEVGEDVGVTGWLKPSVELKTLTIVHTGAGAASSVRIWLAGPQVENSATEELADTGSYNANLAMFALLLSMIGALYIVAARRMSKN